MSPAKRPAKKKMPAFTKAPAETVATFESGLEGAGELERRTMFSYPAAFANGNMFACVFQDRIMVRLSPDDRAEALKIDGAKLFEPMPGRPMREYVELPSSILRNARSLRGWMKRSRAYAASLPAKKARR